MNVKGIPDIRRKVASFTKSLSTNSAASLAARLFHPEVTLCSTRDLRFDNSTIQQFGNSVFRLFHWLFHRLLGCSLTPYSLSLFWHFPLSIFNSHRLFHWLFYSPTQQLTNSAVPLAVSLAVPIVNRKS